MALLKDKQLDGLKYRRQHSIGPYILDFFCPEISLAIELDGNTHIDPESVEYDTHRTEYLNYYGIKVIRFTNTEVFKNIHHVLKEIKTHHFIVQSSDKAKESKLSPDSVFKKEEK